MNLYKPKLCSALFFVMAYATVAHPGDTPAVDQAWLEKARNEIPPVLEKYKSLISRIEEESERRSGIAVAPASVGKGRFNPSTTWERIVRLGENTILEQRRTNDKTPEVSRITLRCENSDYNFVLTKLKADSAYVLGDVAPGKFDYPLAAQGGLYSGMLGYLRSFLNAVEEKPKFTLKSLKYDPAKALLTVDFTLLDSGNEYEERICVDPANGWRVLERRVETKSLVATDEFSYGETIGGMSFPTGCKNLSIYKVKEAPPNLEITAKLISIKLTDKEPYDFRMSAFGLPEPMGMPAVSRATRWHVWFALAAAAILVGGGLVVILKRRYSKAPAAPEATPEMKEGGS